MFCRTHSWEQRRWRRQTSAARSSCFRTPSCPSTQPRSSNVHATRKRTSLARKSGACRSCPTWASLWESWAGAKLSACFACHVTRWWRHCGRRWSVRGRVRSYTATRQAYSVPCTRTTHLYPTLLNLNSQLFKNRVFSTKPIIFCPYNTTLSWWTDAIESWNRFSTNLCFTWTPTENWASWKTSGGWTTAETQRVVHEFVIDKNYRMTKGSYRTPLLHCHIRWLTQSKLRLTDISKKGRAQLIFKYLCSVWH